MSKFDARESLSILVENLAASEANGELFVADPAMLGPLLESTLADFTLLAGQYEALQEDHRRAPQNLTELKIRDIGKGIALHFLARFRRQFLRSDTSVWPLADEIDFAKWCRELNEPREIDPDLQEWLDADLDIFEGVECFRC